MPPIKGGSFNRAFHKSEIEGMMERAAAVPGPGEVYAITTRPPVVPLQLFKTHITHLSLIVKTFARTRDTSCTQYQFEHTDVASSVKPSIKARVASSRRGYMPHLYSHPSITNHACSQV